MAHTCVLKFQKQCHMPHAVSKYIHKNMHIHEPQTKTVNSLEYK